MNGSSKRPFGLNVIDMRFAATLASTRASSQLPRIEKPHDRSICIHMISCSEA